MNKERSGVLLIKPPRFEDSRGWFSETYNYEKYCDRGLATRFVQDNHSLSRSAGVVRGLHFQAPPNGQAKLVSCIRGAIFDVCVDVRRGSPTYGKWAGATLSAENGHQLYIPVGFAHGFVTLEAGTEVFYKVSAYYSAASEGGIAWDDPDLAIGWPLPESGPVLSEKDERLPRLSAFDSPFDYDGTPLEDIKDA